MVSHNKLLLGFLTLNAFFITNIFTDNIKAKSESKVQQINKIISSYKAIVENISLIEEEANTDVLKANDEIVVNKQILIVPTANTISSEENYQFEEYFNKSAKERLIGRLLLEKTLGKESMYNDFIQTLPVVVNDYHHMESHHKEELSSRSLNKHIFEDRKENYEKLVRKIPSNTIPSHMLNYENYNWASSVIQCFSVVSEKKYFNEVRKLDKLSLYYNQENMVQNKEILLIPGLNLFEKAPFDHLGNINLKSSLFAYKDHIYLNSDRYIDENEPVYNELQFQPDSQLFENCGKFIEGVYHEEAFVSLKNKNWNLVQHDLCKAISCVPKNKHNYGSSSISNPSFVLKYEFDTKLHVMCQIDQYRKDNNNEEETRQTMKLLKAGKRIYSDNYTKSLIKCHSYLKEFLNAQEKTPIENDIKYLYKNKAKNDEKLNLVLKYSISQKKIVNHHISMFLNRYLKEVQKDVFGDIKNKYI